MTNPTLIVHHLARSQSERIVWLCEELALEYALDRHERRADNRLAPPEYAALHPMGTAPVITDGELVLGESAAIVDYLIATRGEGRLRLRPDEPGFAHYLYWFHFANGTLQPTLLQLRYLERGEPSPASPLQRVPSERFERALSALHRRLGESPYLAGPSLTAADIMSVFSLTTMRLFQPFDLSRWPNILAYLQRVGDRPGYQRAMRKAEPGLTPVLGAVP